MKRKQIESIYDNLLCVQSMLADDKEDSGEIQEALNNLIDAVEDGLRDAFFADYLEERKA